MKRKKLLSLGLIAALLCSALPMGTIQASSVSEEQEMVQRESVLKKALVTEDGLYEYQHLTLDSWEITGYTGNETELVIPAEINGRMVTSIGTQALAGNKNITKVTIPDSITNIGQSAFDSCTALEEVDIPSSVTNMENAAFNNCTSLKRVTIPSSIKKIKAFTFNQCYELEEVTIPEGITSIGTQGFCMCYKLKKVSLPNSLTSIANLAFADCSVLEEITIPEKMTKIDVCTFDNCPALTTVHLPDGLRTIDDSAFCGCSSLEELDIPESVTAIGELAFYETIWLQKKREANPLVIVNQILIEGTTYKEESLTIPDGVITITDGAFRNNYKLKTVIIPENVTKINIQAFSGCNYLEKVTIPGNVTSIGKWAFDYCDNLTIYGETGSCAHDYATANKIPFVSTGSYEQSLSNCQATLSQTSYEYDGKAKTPTVTVKDGYRTLKEGTHYTVEYQDNTELGTAKVVITGKDYYTGTVTVTFTIQEAQSTNPDNTQSPNPDNTQSPGPDNTQSPGPDNTQSPGPDNTQSPGPDNTQSPDTDNPQVTAKSLSECQITLDKTSVTYNGKAQTPTVTVKDGSKELKINADYTLAYKNNTNAGTAQVAIVGTGSYTGTVTKNFTIQKATQSLTCTKVYKKASGSKPFTLDAKSNGDGTLSYTSSDNNVASADSKGQVTLKEVGIANITVTAKETPNYKAVSEKITIEVSPKKQAVKVKAKKGRKLTVSWEKDTKVTGYQIQYSTDKKFKKNLKSKTIKKAKTVKCTLTKLKKGKKYYVRVRSYKSVNSRKLYGEWSSAKRSGSIKK